MGIVREWFDTKTAELRARRELAASDAKVTESLAQNLYVDLDNLMTDGATADLTIPIRDSLATQRAKSRRLIETDAHARNIVSLIGNFTIGSGFAVKFADAPNRDAWRVDANRLRWKRRMREWMRRIVRDGEVFMRRFGNELRFVEPGFIKNPRDDRAGEGLITEGVEVDPDDFERPLAYWISTSNAADSERIDVSEVFHSKQPMSDLAEPRGRPPLYDAIADIQNYGEWLRYRRLLNKARTHLAFIRKHKGSTPAQIKSFADSIKSGTIKRGIERGSDRLKYLTPGVGVDIDDNVDIQFPKSQLDSRDAAADGRSLRLLISCWVGFAEYMVTCDASNANFSSTMIAETPAIKAMQFWQEFVADEMRSFFGWWFGDGDIQVDFTWPMMVGRDIEKETKSNSTMFEAAVLSRETWQERAGLEPEIENERLAAAGALDATASNG